MVSEGPAPDFVFPPLREEESETPSRWNGFLKFVLYLTFGVAFLFLLISIFVILDPSWGASLNQPVIPFFFVFLLVFLLPPVSIISVFIVMFALYLIFFSAMVYQTRKSKAKNLLDTPIGYFIAAASAIEIVVLVISLLEQFLGAPIGGSGISNQLVSNPLLGYENLIYAPFVEELGFRILPLGVFSFLLVRAHSRNAAGVSNLKDSLISILLPGHIRRKYNLPIRRADWVLIIITSVIFAFAHVYFGEWGVGKLIPVFVTGIALALGFLKFGAYVDIPFHWFFNGLLTLPYVDPSLSAATDWLLLWLLFVGVVSLVAIIVYARKYTRGETVPA